MKLTGILFAALAASLFLGGISTAAAQQERDVIEVVKSQIATQRQALVAENLGLSPEESDLFWPAYRDFHKERDSLVDRRIAILKDFRDNFDGLSDEQAKKLLDDYFKLQEDILSLQKKNLKNFRKILSEKKTLRYYQIEKKLDTIIEYDLAQVVPLAE